MPEIVIHGKPGKTAKALVALDHYAEKLFKLMDEMQGEGVEIEELVENINETLTEINQVRAKMIGKGDEVHG